jgi:septal ring factor EnvC (AmiA/AmiB activator)
VSEAVRLAARPADGRGRTGTRFWAPVPLHVVLIGGASCAMYAVSLAGVNQLQSANAQALAADRAPAAQAVTALTQNTDQVQAAVTQAQAALAKTTAQYDALTKRLADLESRLSTAASTVGAASQQASLAKLPTIHAAPAAAAPPAIHATSGASGAPLP